MATVWEPGGDLGSKLVENGQSDDCSWPAHLLATLLVKERRCRRKSSSGPGLRYADPNGSIADLVTQFNVTKVAA